MSVFFQKSESNRYILKAVKATEVALQEWYNFVPVKVSAHSVIYVSFQETIFFFDNGFFLFCESVESCSKMFDRGEHFAEHY